MPSIYHQEYPDDHAAMVAMRALIASQPPIEFGPEGRPVFDMLLQQTPPADGIAYEATEVGGVPGWWCRPEDAAEKAAVLYLHGGAYVLGSASAYRNFVGQIAFRAKAAAFIPDYRLAPEHPFPAAVEDAQAAFHGLAVAGFKTVALAGDSAGGGLSLTLLSLATTAARARAGLLPAGAAVMSPWTDMTLSGASIKDRADADPLLTLEAGKRAMRLYLGGHDPGDPRVSPLFGNLQDLPPVLLHVGEDEVLLDDSRNYAKLTEAVGGQVELHIWQGMVHVFPTNLAFLRAAREALDNIGAFLGQSILGRSRR